jgi:hypothetical protein
VVLLEGFLPGSQVHRVFLKLIPLKVYRNTHAEQGEMLNIYAVARL